MQREDGSEAARSIEQVRTCADSSLDRICTIGYEGRDIAEFIEVLTSAEVTLVVDVRENAMSRIQGFSKRRLHETLGDSGISYEHLKRLGNPKENRGALRSGDESAVRFFENRLLAEGAEDLRHLKQLLRNEHVALLCFERDHRTCHRSLIADALQAQSRTLDIMNL